MKRIRSLRLRIIFFNSLIIFAALCLVVGGIVGGIIYFLNKSGRADMEFFVTQTAHNLAAKTGLMEDMLLAVRSNPLLMQYAEHGTVPEAGEILSRFRRTVNLYSDKNTADGAQHFISSVYLFGTSGTFLPVHYEPYLQSEQQMLEAQAVLWFKQARKNGFDTDFFTSDTVIAVVFSLYTDFMKDIGSIVFVMEKEPLFRLLQSSSAYKDGFAVIYNKYNANLLSTGGNYGREAFWKFSHVQRKTPFSGTVGGTPCLLYNKPLHMGLNVIIGVPQNRLLVQLIESSGAYLLIVLAGFMLIIILSSITVVRLTVPLKEIALGLSRFDGRNYDVTLPEYDSNEFNEISNTFNAMTKKITRLIRVVYKKRIMLRESELKFLRSQMNPHFMFNVLNTIALQARFDGSDDVFKMVTAFAQLIQAGIFKKENEKICIGEELKLVEFYLYLQSCRFGTRFSYTVCVNDKSILNNFIPKLIIQPLVENAVMHGIEPKTVKGEISVLLERQGNDIHITVSDNGAGFDTEAENITLPLKQLKHSETHNRIGINTIHTLIRIYYGKNYGLTIKSKKNCGTHVTVTVPADSKGGCNVPGNDRR